MGNYDLSSDVVFMRRAMELAGNGAGLVSPNPLVGSVVVHQGKVIGEGWHRKYGEAHAEVNAIQDVGDNSLLSDSTLYVNLEPCSHTGKTPPCADLLVRMGVKRVVVSNGDPNPLVAGKGIEKLRTAGIDVTLGVLEKEGRELNKRFFTMMEKGRPYVILKWAQTSDHFIARENFDAKWISNEYSRQLTHKWRTEEDAILVGTTTAERDNPKLTVRDWSGRNPVRIVIDRELRLSASLNIFNDEAPTLQYNLMRDEINGTVTRVRLTDDDFLTGLLADLQKRKIQSVFVEGGAYTIRQFLSASLWDEARIFTSSEKFLKGVPSPEIKGELYAQTNVQGDSLRILYPLLT